MSNLSFADKLAAATNEDKQVNPIYVNAISTGLKKLNAGIDADHPKYDLYTDGVFDCWYTDEFGHKEWFILQLECKQDVDLNDSEQLAKVVIQVCFYIKQFDGKQTLPKVAVIGTKKNCIVIPVVYLYDNYIKNRNYPTEYNGKSISASTAGDNVLYGPLKRAIADDTRLGTFARITEVNDKNAIDEICKDIIKVAKDIGLKEEITAENMSRAFDYFDMKVLTEKARDKNDSRVKANAFMQLVLNPNKVISDFTEDALGNRIYTGKINFNGTILEVDPKKYNSFANVFAVKIYSYKDQQQITAITDRLIEDTDRRRKGDFYTPTIWVDEAHKLMSKHLGEDWRQKCIVWDCAWGTGNLTRDYEFADLYCSTLHDEDLEIGAKYNPFSTHFQYDFLNDDVYEMESAKEMLWSPFKGTQFYHHKSIEDKVNFKDIIELYTMAAEKNIIKMESAQFAYAKAINAMKSTKLYSQAPKLVDQLIDPVFGSGENHHFASGENRQF